MRRTQGLYRHCRSNTKGPRRAALFSIPSVLPHRSHTALSLGIQVVEISSLTEHLLTECDRRDGFGKCHRCSEAVPKDELPRHIKTKECNRECHLVTRCPPWSWPSYCWGSGLGIVGLDASFLSLRVHSSNQVFVEIISAAKSEKVANRCPLCHENFAPGEEVRRPELRGSSREALDIYLG